MSTTTLRLADPATYEHGVPTDAIDALRAASPVAWQEIDGHAGFWAVLRHADVVTVSRRTDVFSAAAGGIVLEDLHPDELDLMRGMLPAMDPPRHPVYRRPLADTFRVSVMAELEPQIRHICREALAAVTGSGEVDLVGEVTATIPTRIIGRMMGVPAPDWDLLHRLAQQQTSGGAAPADGPDAWSDDPTQRPAFQASVEMALYAMQLAAERRALDEAGAEPPVDLTTLILHTPFGDGLMTDADFGAFFVQLVTAGNDTSTTLLSSAVHALLTHPDQLAVLRAEPGRIPDAVEETLRWANPLHYFRRTAVVDTELGGVHIAAGDKVAMYYTAANRDPDVFVDPHRFDVTRHPNPHVAFGIGVHFCLGAHLARLTARVFLEEVFGGGVTIAAAGEPVRLRSNLVNGFARVPVRLS